VRGRQVFDSDGSDSREHVFGLHCKLNVAWGERRRDGLFVQCRLHGPGWRRVHGVPSRHVQGSYWISSMPLVRGRQVFDSDGSDSREHVFGLHGQLNLSAGERRRDGLFVQCRLQGPGWRRVHGVRSRHVQNKYGIGSLHLVRGRQVFDSDGSDSREHVFGVHGQLRLACGERRRDGLFVQRRLQGSGWRRVHGVRSRHVQGS
jgi:hypothetical protein